MVQEEKIFKVFTKANIRLIASLPGRYILRSIDMALWNLIESVTLGTLLHNYFKIGQILSLEKTF